MFYNGHAPAHFHADPAGQEVLITISTLDAIRGALRSSRLRRILARARDNQQAPALNWLKCQEEQPPEKL